MPGSVVLLAKDGKIRYHKAFGHFTYDQNKRVTEETVYDVASVTKILSTTIGIMMLYDLDRIKLGDRVDDFIPELSNSEVGKIKIRDLLTHHSGLPPSIPIHKEAMSLSLSDMVFSPIPDRNYPLMVTENMYVKSEWNTIFIKSLKKIKLTPGRYAYSDVGFILLGKIIERISKQPLNEFAQLNIYAPLGLHNTGYNPLHFKEQFEIPPTEIETDFRKQKIQGTAHDPVAAMMGGVAGHAGLFSNAEELFVLMQLLLNNGEVRGVRLIESITVEMFTKYQNKSRRGLGFDKPERELKKGQEKYPCELWSEHTFGHTGFTGTAAWADPETNIVFIFLSNRTYPSSSNRKLMQMNIRSKLMDAAYKALITN